MELNKNIDIAVEKNFDEMVESLQGIIRIKSVLDEAQEGKPFGEGPAAALNYALDLCAKLGFRTVNLDNYVGYAEIGEGEEMMGILTHLDVVPEGNGWLYPPYSATIADGKMFGRGTIDDKGPTVSCIYAIKSMIDAGIVPNKRIRIIFGSDEENDWRDIEHYAEAGEEIPTFSIAPDANFPLIYAEKSMATLEVVMDKAKAGIVSVEGGVASNAVPDSAKAVVKAADGTEITVEATGVAAHASLPELGDNAISKLMAELGAKHDAGEIVCPFAKFYNEKIGMDYYGKGFGVDCADETGELTFNVGTIRTEGDSVIFTIDMRCPVTFKPEDVIAKIKAQCEEAGLSTQNEGTSPSLYMDKNSNLVQTLLGVYREITGDTESEPLAIGGATFARGIPNAVAFGALFPGRPLTEHQANEYVEIEDLREMTKIYAQAIAQLVTD